MAGFMEESVGTNPCWKKGAERAKPVSSRIRKWGCILIERVLVSSVPLMMCVVGCGVCN